MNCHEMQEAMLEELYGELPATKRQEVAAHRDVCARCAAAWASLQHTVQVLGQWPDVTPPATLRQRVLAQVMALARAGVAPPWWQRGLARTALAVGAGLAMMVLTVLGLSRLLPLAAITPRALLICGSLWGGVYIGLFRLALAGPGEEHEGQLQGVHYSGAARLALLAIAMATLLLVLGAPLSLELARLLPASGLPFVGGGVVALLALLVSRRLLSHRPSARPMLHTLLAACFFLAAVAPGLLMFCVPFTLGVYLGTLLAVGIGAVTGGMLGCVFGTCGEEPSRL